MHGKGAVGARQTTPGGCSGYHRPGEQVDDQLDKSGPNFGNQYPMSTPLQASPRLTGPF